MKILLGIAGFFVLCIGLVGWKGYSWWQAHGKAYVAAIKASAEDGKTFGRTSDNAACVKSALDRFSDDTTAVGPVLATGFTQNCLRESKPSPGFCDGVPQPSERRAVSDWVRTKCDAMATASSRTCLFALQAVPRYCHPTESSNS